MRPLRLDVEGFTAFRDRLALDLEDLDLFAITGQTGAGKSSLIDAVCYSLYGRVPRVGADVKACISQGLNRMCVTFEFCSGADRYRVFRETRRQGQPNVRLEKLAGGDWQPLAHGARDVTERIERVIGLNYDAFTRSVLLPQGQFQEFLSGSPEKRREVLRALLRLDVYERVRAVAAGLASEKKAELTSLQGRLEQYFAEATPENQARREEELEGARAEAAALASRISGWREALRLAQELAAAVATRDRAAEEHAAAEHELDAARRLSEEGDRILADLKNGVDAAEAELAANEFDADLLAVLAGALNLAIAAEAAGRRVSEADATVRSREVAAARASKAAAEAADAQAAATKALDAAQHAFLTAQRENAAAAVQADLAPGDVCPVCGGKVTSLPVIVAPDLDAAQEAIAAAKRRAEVALETNTAAAVDNAAAASNLAAASEALAQARAQLEADSARLKEALPDAPDRSSAVLRAGMEAQKAARADRDRLATQLAAAQKAYGDKETELEAAARDLAAVERMLEHRRKELGAVEEAACAARTRLCDAAARFSLAAVERALTEDRDPAACAEAELQTLGRRDHELQQEIGRLEALIDRLKDDIEKARQLRGDIARLQSAHHVAFDLAQMLQANKFQAYVQSEALRLLAEQGSLKLRDLSGGRYRLQTAASGQDFEAVDQWNADEARPVKTLSGGETFLASLALALALAESLPGLAPDRDMNLDAIFLDEGFGSLDPEALDRAAEALDSLRDGRRMVCVVTHLPELAQRMPARIMVTKSEAGSTAAVV